MFGILNKFFKFSGKENEKKFKISILLGVIEALSSAMKIPAMMYILMGLMNNQSMGKYITGATLMMLCAIVISIICKRFSTVLQTDGGYNASAFTRLLSIYVIFQWVILMRIVLVKSLQLLQILWNYWGILLQESLC